MGKVLLLMLATFAVAGCGQEPQTGSSGSAAAQSDAAAGARDFPQGQDAPVKAAAEAAASPRAVARNPGQRSGRLTTAEQTYLRDGRISTDEVGLAFRDRDWDEVVRGFDAAGAGDQDARELTRVYREWLSAMADQEGLLLADLSCGLSLCAGTFRGTGTGATAQYDRLRDRLLHSARDYPLYVYMDSSKGSAATHVDFRFFFSMDEEVGAATGAAR